MSPGAVHGGPTADPVTYDYTVRNVGRATITDLSLWIEDADGNAISTRGGGGSVLVSGDPLIHVGVDMPRSSPEPDRLVVEWCDSEGVHRRDTGIQPLRHA